MSYALDFSLALGAGKAGLTDLRAQLVDSTGVSVGSAVSTGFVEIGSQGFYLWHYAAIPDAHRGAVKFYSAAASSTILALAAINPQEAENLDISISGVAAAVWAYGNRILTAFGFTVTTADPLTATVPGTYSSGTAGAALGRIGSGQITTTSIVSQAGDVTVLKGDDYYAADGHAIEWTDSSAGWPDLTSATVLFSLHGPYAGSFTAACSVVTPSGSGKKVRLQLSAAQTSLLVATAHDYEVVATLSDTHVVTLVRGKFYVTGE